MRSMNRYWRCSLNAFSSVAALTLWAKPAACGGPTLAAAPLIMMPELFAAWRARE